MGYVEGGRVPGRWAERDQEIEKIATNPEIESQGNFACSSTKLRRRATCLGLRELGEFNESFAK